MRRVFPFVTGLGIGLGVMYLFDPDRGERRRARLSGRIARLRDAVGEPAAARRALMRDHPTDARILERIRTKLRHLASRPDSIRVDVHDGRVTLAGAIPAGEVHAALRAAGTTPGVREVENQLDPRESRNSGTH
jgi:hypothetical protein